MANRKSIRYLLILLAVVFWGTSFVATKTLLLEIKPVTIIILRLIIASILLTFIAVSTKRNFSLNIKSHGWIFILALIAVFHLWIQVTGLQYTTASNTGWIIGTAPIFMAIMGLIFYKEKITLIALSGILLAVAGLLILFGKGDITNIGFMENRGDLLVLGSAFTWGVYSTVNKKISLSYSPLMTILYLFLMMAIIIIPFNLNSETIASIVHLSWIGWLMVLFLGLFCSGVAYVIWAQALRDMESAKVGAFLYLEPLVTVAAAGFFLKEEITLLMIFSGLLITIGVFLVNKD
ncbi:MAG: DMT family transporter [Ignavibacteriaceae bacterium]|nr:DMT family transporter [Ignavibacteriaceae bacterium]MCW9066524.1 DMT family transporter [Ignavibacteriaceae bacterium]